MRQADSRRRAKGQIRAVPALRECDGEWIRPDFMLPGLNDLIIEYKGMDDFEYNEKFERKLMILDLKKK